MIESKTIYKEASNESVEKLVDNFSKAIDDLYDKVEEDLLLLPKQNVDMSLLLRQTVELRIDVGFILIDLFTSLRGCLKSIYTFEKCYHMKNLEGIRVEGCRLLLGARGKREEALWARLGYELRQECQRFEKGKNVHMASWSGFLGHAKF